MYKNVSINYGPSCNIFEFNSQNCENLVLKIEYIPKNPILMIYAAL